MFLNPERSTYVKNCGGKSSWIRVKDSMLQRSLFRLVNSDVRCSKSILLAVPLARLLDRPRRGGSDGTSYC